jgi:hypothetical protein
LETNIFSRKNNIKSMLNRPLKGNEMAELAVRASVALSQSGSFGRRRRRARKWRKEAAMLSNLCPICGPYPSEIGLDFGPLDLWIHWIDELWFWIRTVMIEDLGAGALVVVQVM